MAEGEADDSLLNPGRQLIGHPRRPALPRPQHLQALALHHGLPAVVPRAVIAELPAGSTDTDLASPGKQLQAVAVEQIIISHGGTSSWASSTHRMGRRFYIWEAPRCLQILCAVQSSCGPAQSACASAL